MGEEKELAKGKIIYRRAVYRTLGFGIGGAIGGAIWFAFDAPYLGFAILGALGGTSLSATQRDLRSTIIIALACTVGFDIGFLLPFFVSLVIWEPVYAQGLFIGGIGGAVGGVTVGLSMKKWRRSWFLALAGAIGFGIAAQVFWDVFRGLQPHVLWGAITLAIWGIVGGASLGAALGHLENYKVRERS